MHADTRNLLSRTHLTQGFSDFLKIVEQRFPTIGLIDSYSPINEGYEDANFRLMTNTGKFVLKIFSSGRSPENIKDYVKIIAEAGKIGVETMELIMGKLDYLQKHDDDYFILTRFFEGENYDRRTPTMSIISGVTTNLALLNTLEFPVEESYDSWGNKNFLKEYDLLQNKLTPQEKAYLSPTLSKLNTIETKSFSKGVIHGDMQRKHVLEQDGKFCIVDYGCASLDCKVFDLSTYLGWFCLAEDTWDNREAIVKLVLKEYSRFHTLTEHELVALPAYTEATYASFFFKTLLLIKDGDDYSETVAWHNSAQAMLERMRAWNWQM